MSLATFELLKFSTYCAGDPLQICNPWLVLYVLWIASVFMYLSALVHLEYAVPEPLQTVTLLEPWIEVSFSVELTRDAPMVVSKPVLCVWNPCQNQLKYWWNQYFSNFVH